MSSSATQPTDEEDAKLFAVLEKHSKKLRMDALELAELFTKTEDDSKDTKTLIMALQNIYSTDISNMDVALNNLKKILASISIHNNDSVFGPNISSELMPQILEKYSQVLNGAVDLAAKAQGLSSPGNE
jgi:hypothetical protein